MRRSAAALTMLDGGHDRARASRQRMARVRRRSRRDEILDRSPTSIARTSRSSRARGSGRRARRRTTAPRTRPGNFQATPLMIGDTLFLSTSYNRVVALDANTGRELWSYDPQGVSRRPAAERHRLRPPRRRDVDRRQAAADVHQQPLESHRARRGDRETDSRLRRHRRRRSHARARAATAKR